MKRITLLGAVLGIALAAPQRELKAQYPAAQPYGGGYRSMGGMGYGRPGLSPYLNMLRGGSPAANYYMGVLPEFERRAFDVQTSSALFDLERRAAAPATGEDDELLPSRSGTGHPAVFGYYQPYYTLGRPALTQPPPGFGRPAGRRGR